MDVAGLAKSFGFNTPPRVKEGKFLTPEAQTQKKKNKKLKKPQPEEAKVVEEKK